MNYYQAREKRYQLPNGEWSKQGDPKNTWGYTVMNDGNVRAIGYCAEGNCNHKSADEAGDCFRKYIKEQCNGKLPGGFDLEEGQGDLVISSSY